MRLECYYLFGPLTQHKEILLYYAFVLSELRLRNIVTENHHQEEKAIA